MCDPGGVSVPGGKTTDGAALAEETVREVDIHLGGNVKGGGGFLSMEDYIRRWQNTVAWYIATRSLLDLCEGSERAPGMQVGMCWWEHTRINLMRAREAVAAAAGRYGGEERRRGSKGGLSG